MAHKPHTPLALIILDGWGYRDETKDNAIAAAKKPHWDEWWETCPHTLISGSGKCVGLPDAQMGNSEVGHLNMGAGRIVYQDLSRIDLAIDNGEFFKNPVFIDAIDHAVQSKKAIHILGLVSSGGVHSHERHIEAILSLAKKRNATQVYLHAFLDGRDTPPQSAMSFLKKFNTETVSLIGRYYAMDRDKRWERTQIAYELLTEGKADYQASNALDAVELAYQRGETDEFVKPTVIHPAGAAPITINEGDTVIFMNFRADRARQLTQSLTDKNFSAFPRKKWPETRFVTLTEYNKLFALPVAFKSEPLKNILADYLSQLGFTQLRIAETEKYAHITFFFNGGIEAPFPGEERILVPSPKVATYDLQPEMSALQVTETLVNEIKNHHHDVIICNFANPDMVGHTGNFSATVQAIETIDACLGKIIAALKAVGGEAIITSDHGNAEKMFDETTHQPHTAHTSELVPFIYIGRPASIAKSNGILSDIAPTLLYLLAIPQPTEMTGETIVRLFR